MNFKSDWCSCIFYNVKFTKFSCINWFFQLFSELSFQKSSLSSKYFSKAIKLLVIFVIITFSINSECQKSLICEKSVCKLKKLFATPSLDEILLRLSSFVLPDFPLSGSYLNFEQICFKRLINGPKSTNLNTFKQELLKRISSRDNFYPGKRYYFQKLPKKLRTINAKRFLISIYSFNNKHYYNWKLNSHNSQFFPNIKFELLPPNYPWHQIKSIASPAISFRCMISKNWMGEKSIKKSIFLFKAKLIKKSRRRIKNYSN